ncbi:MAG: molecular chaperone DnaJ [Clostridiales bacterium]|nr:molecular chaperone DnaJ [Candidatus Apopatousia equi]
MASKDYYETLGVSKSASADEIKSAYRKLAKKYHPDLHPNDQVAAAKFKEINEAYEVLGDEQKKQNYDQFGSADGNPFGAGGFGGFNTGNFSGGFSTDDFGDFGSIFGDIFGGAFGSSRKSKQREVRGDDINLKMDLSFMEACTGVKKTINVSRIETCSECNGTGAKNGTEFTTCPTCNGTGEVRYTQQTFMGRIVNVGPCQDCHGTGKKIKTTCSHCGGAGTVRNSRTINISIPAGIDNDQILTIKNEGHANGTKGSKGDLHLHITVKDHKLLRREGFDLLIDVPLPFTMCLVGGKIKVPGINETIELNIPPLTQTNTVFTLKNKGIPKLNRRDSFGDFKIKVIVEMPKSLDKNSKQMLEELNKNITESDFSRYKDYLAKLK